MRHVTHSLLTILTILLLASGCTPCPKITDDPLYKQSLQRANALQIKSDNLKLEVNVLNLKVDSFKTEIDSLVTIYDYLSGSWSILVNEYDSLLKLPPDTFLFIPQCTLCYKDTVNINGIQYYVGYDGKHYKIFQDSNTVIRQVFFKDTLITRYVIKDSIVNPPEKALISIEASGTKCNEGWPILNMEINGVPVINFNIRSNLPNEYRVNIPKHEYDIDSIRVTYGNDCYNDTTEEDRNCKVSSVMINYNEYLIKENTKLSENIRWESEEPHTIIMNREGSFVIETYKTNGQ